MHWILGNMVWPAIYVTATLAEFWYLVFATIVVEMIVLKAFLKFPWIKAMVISLFGNIVSGLVGIFVMVYAMLFWHLLVDWAMPHATFDNINWVATFILMCAGSVAVETLTIKLIFKERFKLLFFPMLTGNFLTYVFIAWYMANPSGKLPHEVAADKVLYVPDRFHFSLLDKTNTVDLDTAYIKISYDKDGNILNNGDGHGYNLIVTYKLMQSDSFDFHLSLIDDTYTGGIGPKGKVFPVDSIQDVYVMLFEQYMMDSTAGFRDYVPTDTIRWVKRKVVRE